NESRHKLKPDNEARIVWTDSTRSRTEYALVYLHGFSASPMEGDPVHRRFAREFGCNLFLARLADHGIDTVDAMINFTSDRWWKSAREALAIGKALGDKVIVMSTSTGGTMAIALAADFPEDVHALLNMSPNIAINNGGAFLLNNPWGLYIARLVTGGKYNEWDAPPERKAYWYAKYRLEATVQLEEMLESRMTQETFQKVVQPCLTLYYYKSDKEQDPEVKVSAMLEMMDQITTPEERKRAVALPDAGAHVLGSSLVSHDVEGAYAEMQKFAREVLRLQSSGE
ncbi:MAG TPA: alpha/beta hydrolase, partial [Cyclobacteriaceae bacterium]